ncbi:unnamed protein product [Hymenolepis diminuta]|uniref:Uncharacterized protein n=1 Tax=Hymenolepis diminuta TaxID=6216 RepID=A0A564YHX3_HYMDI|nr:unnamed protein product [Hymenolepis diminuta]
MSKRVHRFPFFSITASLHLKSTSALMFSRGLTQVLSLFPTQEHARRSGTSSYASCSSPLFLSVT